MKRSFVSLVLLLTVSCSQSAPTVEPAPSSIATQAPTFSPTVQPLSQPSDLNSEQKIKWLKENAIRVRSISPDDEDFSDLEYLKPVIGNARILMLGEQSHGDGTTFLAKTRLVKFLHQKMGFDVLAFESGLYDCKKSGEFLQSGENPYTAFSRGVFSIWSQSQQVQPLINYLGKMATTDRPLELAGFDNQFTGSASKDFLLVDLENFLAQIGSQFPRHENWTQFKLTVNTLIVAQLQFVSPAPLLEDQDAFFEMTKELQKEIQTRSSPKEKRTASFWIQMLRSMTSRAKAVWLKGLQVSPVGLDEPNLRDVQMAENLIWLSNEYYPNRKVIVWAHNGHIMRNPRELKGGFSNAVTMGDIVWKTLDKETYALGFISHEGKRLNMVTGVVYDLDSFPKDDLEDLMNTAGFEFGVIDFRYRPISGEWLNQKIGSRVNYELLIEADWTRNFDGMFFIKTMTPSTRVGK